METLPNGLTRMLSVDIVKTLLFDIAYALSGDAHEGDVHFDRICLCGESREELLRIAEGMRAYMRRMRKERETGNQPFLREALDFCRNCAIFTMKDPQNLNGNSYIVDVDYIKEIYSRRGKMYLLNPSKPNDRQMKK